MGISNNEYLIGSYWVIHRKELQICCLMNIEIKGSHAYVVTSGISDHLPISDDRLHNIFVNAFARVPANSIIAARHNCRECMIALRKSPHLDLTLSLKFLIGVHECFSIVKKLHFFRLIIVIFRRENLIS